MPGFEFEAMRTRGQPLCVNLVLLILENKQVGVGGDSLRASQQQVAARLQRVMKHRDHALLKHGFEIDQDVAATDQVQLGERRIFCQVLPREHAQVAHGLVDLVSAVVFHEELFQALGRHVGADIFEVNARPGLFDCFLADVGSKDLDRQVLLLQAQELEQRDRNGIHFFPGGAAGNPDPDRRVGRQLRDDFGEDLRFQGLKHLRVAKKPRDFDEYLAIQRVYFRRVLLEQLDVGLQGVHLVQRHAAADSPPDGGVLIEAEIH